MNYFQKQQCAGELTGRIKAKCFLTAKHAGQHVGHDTNNHGQLVTWKNKKENEK